MWTESLVEALTVGFKASYVEFPDDDADVVLAYNVAVHEEGGGGPRSNGGGAR